MVSAGTGGNGADGEKLKEFADQIAAVMVTLERSACEKVIQDLKEDLWHVRAEANEGKHVGLSY